MEIGLTVLTKHLTEQAVEVQLLERRLVAARKRRRALILKLLTAGFSERAIAALAGCSGPAVHQMKTDHKGNRA